MHSLDVVIQGPYFNAIVNNIKRFVKYDNVNNIIVSTWDDVNFNDDIINHEKVILLKNKYPEAIGPTGTTYALVSSLNGIKLAKSDIVMKIRSDYDIPDESFAKHVLYYENNRKQETIKYLNGSPQKSKVFVTAIHNAFPYHIQDHTYYGYKSDLLKIFDIPPEITSPYGNRVYDGGPQMFNMINGRFRAPIHIGVHYFAKFYEKAQHHLNNWKLYFCDDSPKFNEALNFYREVKEEIFKPLPKIDIYWEKYNSNYHYERWGAQGEYYAD